MKHSKAIFLFFIVVLAFFSQNLMAINKLPIKVACIGNSITYGAGVGNIPLNSYPAQLQRLLGVQWEVRNFGVSGRTMLRKGDYPYWKEEAFVQAKDYQPDIVIIKLGTNDSKPHNWVYGNEFYADYKLMIKEFKGLSSKPQILICKPVPAYAVQWGINDSVIVNGVIPVVNRLAVEEKLQIVDLYKALSGKSQMFPDKIHPNSEGACLIAKSIYTALTGKSAEVDNADYPGICVDWHGFKRYNFQYERRNAHIVVPSVVAPGKPWVWRARFPEWHYQMDSILLTKGFHIAYLNTDELLGSPSCVQIWNNFYNYLTKYYNFNNNVAIEGVSRGGLYVFNFAKKYPNRISSIYVEAPVCDFKSWPGGKGTGKGDSESWKLILKAYGFKSEQEALNYKDNPIDNLDSLANAKVPIFFSVGLNDSIVPPNENSFLLFDRYIRLGGVACIYTNTKGKQSLQGHHFPIDDVNAGVAFIQNSYQNK